jgi:hypothetical protein
MYIYQRGHLFDLITVLFLINLAEFPAMDEFAEEIAVLLMDNQLSHIISDMIGLLTDGRVCITTVAPDTTQIFQLFDATLFAVLKRHPGYELPFGDKEVAVKFLVKGYHGFKQITVDFKP